MGKKHDLPAMPMYWGDWFKCPEVRALSPEARCLWFEMLGLMWESTDRGYLTLADKPMSKETLGRCLGFACDLLTRLLTELSEYGVYSVREDGAIYNRRMVRDAEISTKRAIAGKRGGLCSSKLPSKFQANTQANTEDEDEDSIKRINTAENTKCNNEESSARVDLDTQQIPILLQEGNTDWRLSISTFEQFDAIRKAYPGTRRGNRTELDCFLQHHDAQQVIDKLMPAIAAQTAHRKRLVAAGDFCPNWPHFGTWLKGRQWELEFETSRPQPPKDTAPPPAQLPPEDRPASPEEIAALMQSGLQTHVPKNAPPTTPSPSNLQLTDEISELLSPHLPAFRITNLRKMVKNLTPDLVRSKLQLMDEEPRTDPGSFLFQAIVFNYQSKKHAPLDNQHVTAVDLNHETNDSSPQPTVTSELKA